MRPLRFLSLLLIGCLLLTGCAPVSETAGETDAGSVATESSVQSESSSASQPLFDSFEPAPPFDRSPLYTELRESRRLLYGLGEPLYADFKRNFNMDQIYDWIEALGVQSFRLWTPLTTCLSSPARLDLMAVQRFREMAAALQARGVTVIGMSHSWYQPEGLSYSGSVVPPVDHTPGSEYMRFLALYRDSWALVVEAIPEITLWEVGNEPNVEVFLHTPDGEAFSPEDQAIIACDMTYYAAQGVHSVHPEALVVMPSIAATDGMQAGVVPAFLEAMYSYIESGEGPGSTDPDDYFDVVCWHPYTPEAVNKRWRQDNDDAYAVMQAHGDGDKPVFFTEFGYTDLDQEIRVRAIRRWYADFFEQVAEMEYVSGVQIFRMFNEMGSSWGSEGEKYFGLFTEPGYGFAPKELAYDLQTLYGGTGQLSPAAEK